MVEGSFEAMFDGMVNGSILCCVHPIYLPPPPISTSTVIKLGPKLLHKIDRIMERHNYFNLGGRCSAMDTQARDDVMQEIKSTVKVCVCVGLGGACCSVCFDTNVVLCGS